MRFKEIKTYVSFEHRCTNQLLFTVATQEFYKGSYSMSVLDSKVFCPKYSPRTKCKTDCAPEEVSLVPPHCTWQNYRTSNVQGLDHELPVE